MIVKYIMVAGNWQCYENKEVEVVKKKAGYVIKKLEEEYVLLPTGELAEQVNEVISLSETAGFIYLHADQAASVEELADLVSREYGIKKEEVLEDVQMVVETLCKRGVLQQGCQPEAYRPYGKHGKPEKGKKTVKWIFDRKIFSIPDKAYQLSAYLIRAKRTFHLRLIVTYHVDPLRRNAADAVQDKNTMIPAIQNHIIFTKGFQSCLLDQSFISAGNEKRVHAVALRLELQDISILKKLFHIYLV